MTYSIIVTLLIASIGIFGIQAQYREVASTNDDDRFIAAQTEAQKSKVSQNDVPQIKHTIPSVNDFNFDNLDSELDAILKHYQTQSAQKNSTSESSKPLTTKTGPSIAYGSEYISRNNKYGPNENQTQSGPQDIFINNVFPNNPNGTNRYASVLIEENNTYIGNNDNAQDGVLVTKIGNVYPDNPGKNDIHNPTVIRRNNTYLNGEVNSDKKSLNESKLNESEKAQNNTENHAPSAEDRAFNNQSTSPTDTNDYIPTLRNEDIARNDTKSKPDSASGEKFNSHVTLPPSNNTSSATVRNEEKERGDTKSKPDSVNGEKFNSHVTLPPSNDTSSATVRNEEKPKNITKYQAHSSRDSLHNKQPSLSYDKSVYYFLHIFILYSLFYNK